MDFFNNQGDNSQKNEVLLDAIMQEQKKRETKHDIKKGYLLSKKVGKVTNPFDDDITKEEAQEIENGVREFNHKPVSNSSGQPVFVVGSRFTSKKPMSKKAKVTILVASLVAVVLIVATFCAVFFLSKHKFDIVCGNIEGIAIYNEKNEEINSISLRMYETISFKIEVKENYSNSKVEVWYNDKQVIPDKNGYYVIKYVGEDTKLKISGIVENDYDMIFDNNSNFKYLLTNSDGTKEYLNGKTKNNYYGNKLQFTLYDAVNGLTLPQHLACVYDNGVLLTPNSNNVYELNYDKQHNLTSYYHSPLEYFNFTATYDTNAPDTIVGYKLTSLTEMGANQKVISLPSSVNGVSVEYAFDRYEFYLTTTEVVVANNAQLNTDMFDHFTDLQKITVNNLTGSLYGYYSENGLLYQNQATALIDGSARSIAYTNVLIKVPMGYGKNLTVGERILSVNPDMIGTNAIYRLNYIKTLIIGESTSYICPLAFKGTSISSEYNYTVTINTSNPYFVAENNVVYSVDKSQIISAQFASGEFTVADNVAILENAFAFSNITTLTFSGKATLGENALQDMKSLTKIVMPTNTGSIKLGEFFGCDNLSVIDLTNVSGTITISDTAIITSWDNVKIVVSDANLEVYKNAFADTAMENCFISASEFNA